MPCHRLGGSDATRDRPDDSADLVGCQTAADAQPLAGRAVGEVAGITVVSVSRAAPAARQVEPGDARVPGTDFNATAQIGRDMDGGSPTGSCQAGVKRNPFGDGTDVMEVTRPNGMPRALFFKDGKLRSGDGAQSDVSASALTFRQQGDTVLVSSGPERYRIPEALITGG